jgi:hypothetical protein
MAINPDPSRSLERTGITNTTYAFGANGNRLNLNTLPAATPDTPPQVYTYDAASNRLVGLYLRCHGQHAVGQRACIHIRSTQANFPPAAITRHSAGAISCSSYIGRGFE